MNKKQKKNLQRIIIALILVLILKLLPQFPTPVELVLYCIPYLVVGWDVLRKALLGIKNRQPFDECFLMAVATVGAFALGDYVEGCAVIIFYQIGELFQSVAVGKSRQSISSLMDIRPDYANVEDEDGKLEQRWIQTGRDLWGSYTQIRGGLTVDDYVAFPYGRDVKPGAATVEATADQLYGGM